MKTLKTMSQGSPSNRSKYFSRVEQIFLAASKQISCGLGDELSPGFEGQRAMKGR